MYAWYKIEKCCIEEEEYHLVEKRRDKLWHQFQDNVDEHCGVS